VKHVIDARYGARANGHIEKAARDELDAIQQMCDVFATPRREVVDYNDVLAPLDERFGWRAFRRAEIGAVSPVPERGAVRVEPAATASHVGPREPIELLRLGHAAVRHAARFRELRDAAAADATRLIGVLMADVSYAQRDRLGTLLVDGRPIDRSGAGDAWAVVEGAVLAEPVFAASYRALVERGGEPNGLWESLQAIARLAHRGCRAGSLRVPPFNGRLFSPAHAPLAESVANTRPPMATATSLSCIAPGTCRSSASTWPSWS